MKYPSLRISNINIFVINYVLHVDLVKYHAGILMGFHGKILDIIKQYSQAFYDILDSKTLSIKLRCESDNLSKQLGFQHLYDI